jgi:hypothetical protein
MKQLLQNDFVRRILGRGALDDIDGMAFSGSTVDSAVAAVERAILTKDAETTYNRLDRLTHLIEIEFDRLSDGDLASKPLVWRTSVLKISTIRSQNATARITEFGDLLAHKNQPALTLLERQLGLIEAFANLTRQKMVDADVDFTPEIWCKSLTPDRIKIRSNLGIACYYVSRSIYMFQHSDAALIRRLNRIFERNFDLMLYAFSFGTLLDDAPDLRGLLEAQFAKLERFVSEPQPPIAEAPDLFLLGPQNMQHVLTTANQIKELLGRKPD